MGIGTSFAVYFLIWWVTLFVVLPFGLRTQEEDNNVTLGTTSSAPSGRITAYIWRIFFLFPLSRYRLRQRSPNQSVLGA
jgi:predicted secreted protein